MADGKAVGLELTVAIKQLLFLFHYLILTTCHSWALLVLWERLGYTLCLLVCTRPKQFRCSDASLFFQVVRNLATASFPGIQLGISLTVGPAGL